MPRQQLRTDFVKADLDAGFALLRLAQSRSRSVEEARRAVAEADGAYAAGRRGLAELRGADAARLGSHSEKLRVAIEAVKAQLDTPGAVAQMIPRGGAELGPRHGRRRVVC